MQIGVDFGGTKIEAAAIDESGNFIARLRAANPGNYDAAIATVCDLVRRIEAETGQSGSVGAGIPGSVSPATGLIRNANSTYLNGRRFGEDLSAALKREIRLANDANCLALSEAVDGAGAGGKIVFAVILGTGCGGGIAAHARLLEGANAIAGEWGHNPLPWMTAEEFPGPQCWCGKRGCTETFVSGTGFAADYRRQSGREATGEEIVARLRAGDPEAGATFARYGARLGRALAAVCNLIDPDVIVLGGGMSNVAELYPVLPQAIRDYVFSDVWNAVIAPAQWGDSSGVRGAARLWPLV
jgi:fructokinase